MNRGGVQKLTTVLLGVFSLLPMLVLAQESPTAPAAPLVICDSGQSVKQLLWARPFDWETPYD